LHFVPCQARIPQGVLNADFLLQESLHLDRVFAACGLKLALNVV
jgi:hypothetical protein